MIPIRIRSASLAHFGYVVFVVLASAVVAQSASTDVIVVGTNDGIPNVFPFAGVTPGVPNG